MTLLKDKITIRDLQRKGLPIIPGRKYIPKSWISKKKKIASLAEIHRRLSKIKGSLAETVAELRDQE